MISQDDRLIFVHLRRTGGNSIEVALGGIVLFDRWFRRTNVWNNRLHRGKSWRKWDRRGHRIHATAVEIRAEYPREFDDHFKFSIVRNPWEQMASLYGRLHPDDEACRGFRSWLWRFDLAPGTVPRDSLFDESGRCMVDFVGRFERLQDDFDVACDRAGIPRRRLARTNASGGRSLTEMYDDASILLVSRLFADDIHRYGYSFAERESRGSPTARAA